MFAIIKTGGKQYKVQKGDRVRIEKIGKKVGSKVTFNKILLIADKKGKDKSSHRRVSTKVKIGMPKVRGAKVEAKILSQSRAKKVEIIKYKPKTRYRKKRGHHQPYTEIEITKINLTT